MADWSRREVSRTVVEYTLPLSTNHIQVAQIIGLAREDVLKSRAPGGQLYDDDIEVTADDECIIVRYVKQTSSIYT